MLKAVAGTAANSWTENTNTQTKTPTTTCTNTASHLDQRIIEQRLVSLLCNHSHMMHHFLLVTRTHTKHHLKAQTKHTLLWSSNKGRKVWSWTQCHLPDSAAPLPVDSTNQGDLWDSCSSFRITCGLNKNNVSINCIIPWFLMTAHNNSQDCKVVFVSLEVTVCWIIPKLLDSTGLTGQTNGFSREVELKLQLWH